MQCFMWPQEKERNSPLLPLGLPLPGTLPLAQHHVPFIQFDSSEKSGIIYPWGEALLVLGMALLQP